MTPAVAFAAPLTNRGPRLSDLAFDRLATAIVEGEFQPGELLRDQVLAEQLGVSRMPVREALLRLERAGLVETSASRYTRVAIFTPERVRAVIEYAGFVFGSAMRMSVGRMTECDRVQALILLDDLVAAETVAQHLAAMGAVYRFTMATAGNEVLSQRGDVAFMFACAVRALPEGEFQASVGREAQHLRDAVAAGDADGAEAALRRMHGVV